MTERARATAARASWEAAASAAAISSTLGDASSSLSWEGATRAEVIAPPACSSASARARSNCFANENTCWTASSRMRSTIVWNICAPSSLYSTRGSRWPIARRPMPSFR